MKLTKCHASIYLTPPVFLKIVIYSIYKLTQECWKSKGRKRNQEFWKAFSEATDNNNFGVKEY
jgi:hypothetical protein